MVPRPRYLAVLARLLIPRRNREFIVGDLDELHRKRVSEQGPLVANLRYLKGVFASALAQRFGRGAREPGAPSGGPLKGPGSMLGILLGDVRYAVRTLRKSPGFTAVVVLSLALGIGATSTIFSALNAILLRPLPFADPDRLVHISENSTERPDARRPLSWSTYLEWKEHSPAFSQLELVVRVPEFSTVPATVGFERIWRQYVTPGLFRLLGVEPILGRDFVADDAPNSDAWRRNVIISHGYWQRRFGADPGVIGQALRDAETEPLVVIGVMPPGFRVFPENEADMWWPLRTDLRGELRWAQSIGRLNPGVSIEGAQTQLDAIARRVDQSAVFAESGWRVRIDPLHEVASERFTSNLYLLMGAAVLLLLLACSNVASLLVGRATNRHREITTRAALGAGRLRLMGQLLTESVVLALFGGALGVLMALVGTRLFVILAPTWYLPKEEIRVDGMVLGFTLGLSLLTAILFGMAPALRASSPDLARSLKQGARSSPGGSRPLVQNLLVGSQIALTLVLLAGAGLMVNSFVRLVAVDRGFDPEHLLTANVSLEPDRYLTVRAENDSEIVTVSPEAELFYRELLERLRALHGVESAAMLSDIIRLGFTLPGRPTLPPGAELRAQYEEASPEYFVVMGTPLLRGRSFTERDTESSSWVAIVNEAFAHQHFPDEDPIGRFLQVSLTYGGQVSTARIDRPREIVGIVRDTRPGNPRREAFPTIHVPDTQHLTEFGDEFQATDIQLMKQLVLKTTLEPMGLAADLRRVVADVDPEAAVLDILTMDALLHGTVTAERFWMRALGIFATLALVLAVIGIYGVVSYAVEQRTHEIGVRMALGAQRSDVLEMVVGQGMVTTVGGVILGLLGAVAATRLLSSWLYGVEATDPVTFVTVSLVLVGIAVLASYVPARRAARVDPLIALRSE